jgi:hypothetical protein
MGATLACDIESASTLDPAIFDNIKWRPAAPDKKDIPHGLQPEYSAAAAVCKL